jgi:TPP-dependent pyruvate/acetoin dehydrogenase alpha subunit
MEEALTKEKAVWMYQKMLEIRYFEDRVHQLFAKGILPGFVHLYAGEEAVAAGVCAIRMMKTPSRAHIAAMGTALQKGAT